MDRVDSVEKMVLIEAIMHMSAEEAHHLVEDIQRHKNDRIALGAMVVMLPLDPLVKASKDIAHSCEDLSERGSRTIKDIEQHLARRHNIRIRQGIIAVQATKHEGESREGKRVLKALTRERQMLTTEDSEIKKGALHKVLDIILIRRRMYELMQRVSIYLRILIRWKIHGSWEASGFDALEAHDLLDKAYDKMHAVYNTLLKF